MVNQTTHCVTGDVAFAVTRDGEIALWNPAAETILGYSASEAIGQHCWKLLCGRDVYGNPYCSEHCTLRKMAFQSDAVNNYEASFKSDSGGWKRFLIKCLLVLSTSKDDLLLHICHPQKEEIQPSRGHPLSRVGKKLATLTKREIEVLSLLTAGKSTSQIASRMCISTPTVRNHVQHLLNKLKVHSRIEAIMLGRALRRDR